MHNFNNSSGLLDGLLIGVHFSLCVPPSALSGTGFDARATASVAVQPTGTAVTPETSSSLCDQVFGKWAEYFELGRTWNGMSTASQWTIVDLGTGYTRPGQAAADLQAQGLDVRNADKGGRDVYLDFDINEKPLVGLHSHARLYSELNYTFIWYLLPQEGTPAPHQNAMLVSKMMDVVTELLKGIEPSEYTALPEVGPYSPLTWCYDELCKSVKLEGAEAWSTAISRYIEWLRDNDEALKQVVMAFLKVGGKWTDLHGRSSVSYSHDWNRQGAAHFAKHWDFASAVKCTWVVFWTPGAGDQ